jgi:putative redox protein
VKVVARRREGFTHDVEIEGGHTLVIDEPEDAGGADAGPSPTRTLGAALAACTAITCEMYAQRKGWELGRVEVEVDIEYEPQRATVVGFAVTLRVPEPLSDDQQQRLLTIAGKCPVHRVIASTTPVTIVDKIESPPAA